MVRIDGNFEAYNHHCVQVRQVNTAGLPMRRHRGTPVEGFVCQGHETLWPEQRRTPLMTLRIGTASSLTLQDLYDRLRSLCRPCAS